MWPSEKVQLCRHITERNSLSYQDVTAQQIWEYLRDIVMLYRLVGYYVSINGT